MLTLIVFTAVPMLLLTGLCLYLEEHKNSSTLSLVIKGCCTFIPVCLAFAGALRDGGSAWVLFTAALLCLAADIAIRLNFLAGMAIFAAAHLCFIPYFLLLAPFNPLAFIPLVIIYSLLVWENRARIPAMGIKILPFAMYTVILTLMFGMAVTLPLSVPTVSSMIVAVGASLFVFSDIQLSRNVLDTSKRWRDRLVLWTYFPAVYLLVISTYF